MSNALTNSAAPFGDTWSDPNSPNSLLNQMLWSRQKAAEKAEALTLAQCEYDSLGTAEKESKGAKDKLKEARRQAAAAQQWINHVVLSDALPNDDPNDLLSSRDKWAEKTNKGNDIPTTFEFAQIVADELIQDKKAKDFDVIMPRWGRILDIRSSLQGTELQQQSLNTPNFRYECKENFEISSSEASTTTGLSRVPNVLYRKIDKFVKVKGINTETVTKNWASSQNWYKDDSSPGLKFEAPVTGLQHIRILWTQAHVKEDGSHRGRDATFLELKRGISSEISKSLVEKINERCPRCKRRVEASKEAAEKAEPKRGGKRDAKRKAQAEVEPERVAAMKRQRRDTTQK